MPTDFSHIANLLLRRVLETRPEELRLPDIEQAVSWTLDGLGRDAIREFVRAGGGYIGVCAGAYLAASDKDYQLSILNARVVDRRPFSARPMSAEINSGIGHWNARNDEG